MRFILLSILLPLFVLGCASLNPLSGISSVNMQNARSNQNIYRYKGYAVFVKTGEEAYVDIEHNLQNGTARFNGLTSKGVICQGTAWPTSQPRDPFCTGQTSAMQITCNDGRTAVASLILDHCTQGAGAGLVNNERNNIIFVSFGGAGNTLKVRALAFGNKLFGRSQRTTPVPSIIQSPATNPALAPTPTAPKPQIIDPGPAW